MPGHPGTDQVPICGWIKQRLSESMTTSMNMNGPEGVEHKVCVYCVAVPDAEGRGGIVPVIVRSIRFLFCTGGRPKKAMRLQALRRHMTDVVVHERQRQYSADGQRGCRGST